ncbi:ubiquitin-conjugating enzyme E2 22-like [Camellia sinensis]|uniref:ubiquitin-conjugating enzyme E2 22-like n=1 Tax=Camellia sinensis TaxID=4442 RepID=UPI0010364DCC|nr:ubiquitin-conjugating enzyme E2 22-like [Camellia sinensis]
MTAPILPHRRSYLTVDPPPSPPLLNGPPPSFCILLVLSSQLQLAAEYHFPDNFCLFKNKLFIINPFPYVESSVNFIVGYFLTKIFHPNIATNGEICVNTLKKDWNPSLGLRHVLIVVRCLLIEPFPESALNEQAGMMLLENYKEYARHARLYTGIHALKQKSKFKSGAISESTTALNVDQSNTSVLSVDEKKASSGAALPLPSPLASTTTFTKGGNGQDQSASYNKEHNLETNFGSLSDTIETGTPCNLTISFT